MKGIMASEQVLTGERAQSAGNGGGYHDFETIHQSWSRQESFIHAKPVVFRHYLDQVIKINVTNEGQMDL